MKSSLVYQVIVAIGLGIGAGLLFGPYCAILTPISQIFFKLVQMAILPYLLFLLIHGLGSLSPETAKKLLHRGWVFFVILWAAGFAVVYFLSILIPIPQLIFVEPTASGSAAITMNLVSYLIPKSMFYDLANNIIPAVALGGLIGGLALMSIEKKDHVLNFFAQVNASIEKIFEWLVKVSPIIIFSNVAVSTGTIKLDNLEKVALCIGVYIVGTAFLTFWFLPVLLTSLTRLTYKEVMKEFKNVCLVPFATGIPGLAFPFIYTAVKRLAQRYDMDGRPFHTTAQTVIPVSFVFGQLGNFFLLFFIFFLSHHPLTSVEEFLAFALVLPLSFGNIFSSYSSISLLINKFNFPLEAYQVFMTTSAVTMSFQVLLSVAGILTLIILILTAYYGMLKVRWGKLALNLIFGLGVFITIILVAKPFLRFEDNFTFLYRNLKVSEVIKHPPAAKIYYPGDQIPPTLYPSLAVMERVLKSGVLRVGYFHMDTPFSYMNRFGELAGYDVSFAYKLASDLDCALEFIPLDVLNIGKQLDAAEFDIVMSALVMTEQRLTQMDFVRPMFEENNVLIVPLDKKAKFLDLDHVVAMGGLKMGGIGAYYETLQRHFPLAATVPLQDFSDLLNGKVDAVLWNYLSSFVWCLSNPSFTIVDYQGRLGKHFFSYAVADGQVEWKHFLQNWLTLKDASGFSAAMYNYWILGQQPVINTVRRAPIQDLIEFFEP
jgi:Na+/H+-dicarboxylate symporter/ABC-type amino acid transport substrate-binding protein